MNTDIFDQLGEQSLASVDTSFPLLQPDTYEFEITNMEHKTSERTGGKFIAVSLVLRSEGAVSVTGSPIAAGYPITHMISTTTTDKMDQDAIRRNLAQFMDAVIGKEAREEGTPFDISFATYLHQRVYAKVKTQPPRENTETGESYDSRSIINTFIPQP